MPGNSNDEVNSLATHEYAHIFGKSNVWQIPTSDKDNHPSTSVAAHRRGRICFSGEPTFKRLEKLASSGGLIVKTQLTEVFNLQNFFEVHGDDAIIMFLHDNTRGLRPAETDLEDVPPGTTIYAMVSPS